MTNPTITPALLDLAAALRRTLPLLVEIDPTLARQAQGVETLIARRLSLPTPRPGRAERRRNDDVKNPH